MYTFDSVIRYSEVDITNNLNLLGMVNYFQDCCTLQSEDIGVGVEQLHNRNLTWVLVSWNIQVMRFPGLGEKVSIGTFPYAFKDCFGMRNFIMKSSEGEVLAMGDSLWTLIDYKNGNMVRPDEDMRNRYKLEDKLDMDYKKGKIRVPNELEELEPVRILYHHLDVNNHVNNGQFIEMALDILKNNSYSNLRVEYRKQVRADDEIHPYIGKNDTGTVILFKNSAGEKCTIMEFI